jgi:hypothetical protein
MIMREPLKILLTKLEVPNVLQPYEAHPWSVYDADQEITCSAEVRMDGSEKSLECEIQIIRDKAIGNQKAFEQILFIKCEEALSDQKWTVSSFTFMRKDQKDLYGWEEKAVLFFSACVQKLKQNEIPDFEKLAEDILTEGPLSGGGSGGRKAPKIRPNLVLNKKPGGGF